MYIIFKNDKEVLRYYTEVLPDVFKDDKVVEVDSIPEKDGYIAKAKLVNDEIQWTYEKINAIHHSIQTGSSIIVMLIPIR